MKVIALDVGTKTIGIAIGWTTTHLTQPVMTLQRKSVKKDARVLEDICKRQDVTKIVVGLPVELDGTEGRSARLARQVGDELQSITGLPTEYQDEQYSTLEAEKRLRESGKNSREQKQMIDQVAAMVILEDWFAGQKKN